MLTRLKKFILLLGDFFSLSLALFLTIALRYSQNTWAQNFNNHLPYFLVVFFIWLVVFFINDLYNLNLRASGRKFFLQTMNAAALSSLLSVIYFYLNVNASIAPKTNLVIFIIIFVLLFFIWRGIYQALVSSLIPKNNLAIIGFNSNTELILNELKNNPGSGYETALIFKNVDEMESLVETVKEKNIRAIVVCDDFGQSEKMREALFSCLAYNITFFDYPSFYELLTGKVPVNAIDSNWFLENIKEGEKNYFNFLKRIVDLFSSLIILIISLPFWPLIILGIVLSGRGPIFFTQNRFGKNEIIFKMIKFRTMKVDGNNGTMTVEGDKRITTFGKFLRKTRLDEIPQVINIIKGEMSFIGPRPERPEIVAELEHQIPFYKTRLLIKPGITGWDQVSGNYHSPSLEDTREKLQYDLFYLKHRSMYLDLAITLKTVATVLSREGR
jgi:exopolysaccharide biosynthesis polyprenyl glycosylphosphotransferase